MIFNWDIINEVWCQDCEQTQPLNIQGISERTILAPIGTGLWRDQYQCQRFIPRNCDSLFQSWCHYEYWRCCACQWNILVQSQQLPFHLINSFWSRIFLLRKISPTEGLFNRTWLFLRVIGNIWLLEATIATGESSHKFAMIPRMSLEPTDSTLKYTWQQRQFPLTVTSAMTINKHKVKPLRRLFFGCRTQSLHMGNCM